MKNISKILVAMLCLTMITGITLAEPTYAINDLGLRIDNHNLNTASSWFQPVVVRQVSGRSYAFTVAGPVYFTKESKKWPGAYLDSSSLPFYMPSYICKEYRSPYIKGGKIGLGWISLDQAGTGLTTLPNNNIHYTTVEFGDTSGVGSVKAEF